VPAVGPSLSREQFSPEIVVALAALRRSSAGDRAPPPACLRVSARRGPSIVPSHGAKRLLGPYSDESWPPHGLLVAAVRGRVCSPSIHTATFGGHCHTHRRSSPLLFGRRGRGGLVPERLRALLAFADTEAGIHFADADSGRTLWRLRVDAPSNARLDTRRPLPDFRQLAGHAHRGQPQRPPPRRESQRRRHRRDRRGNGEGRLRRCRPRRAQSIDRGHQRLAESQDAARLLRPRPLSSLAWSPDGKRLALGWTNVDQLLFLRTSGRRPGFRAVSGLARQFDPAAPRPRFPTLGGCCGRDDGES